LASLWQLASEPLNGTAIGFPGGDEALPGPLWY